MVKKDPFYFHLPPFPHFSDGQYQAIASYGISAADAGDVFYSKDYGKTWATSSLASKRFNAMASSKDGQIIIVCAEPGYCYISSNYGETFQIRTQELGVKNWVAVATDQSGTKFWAANEDG